MPRGPRKHCESCVYHVVLRGVNRQKIFLEQDDYSKFLEIIEQKKQDNRFELFGYCLMINHVHLLIREKNDTLSRIMHRIGTSYALWINQKYERSGHVFQGRFGSECIENEGYLLTVIRYIHNNPVKAKIVDFVEDYCWSSIHSYLGSNDNHEKITDTGFILDIFSKDRSTAIHEFHQFMQQKNDNQCLDDQINLRKKDKEAKAEIISILDNYSMEEFQMFEVEQKKLIIRKIKNIQGISLRQIARILGVTLKFVFKA